MSEKPYGVKAAESLCREERRRVSARVSSISRVRNRITIPSVYLSSSWPESPGRQLFRSGAVGFGNGDEALSPRTEDAFRGGVEVQHSGLDAAERCYKEAPDAKREGSFPSG